MKRRETTSALDLPTSPDQRTGFLLSVTHQLTRKGFNQALRPLEIETRHLGVMTAIAAHGTLSQARIVELLALDKSVVVLIVDDLERLGLAKRGRDPVDRRAHAVHITGEGRKRLAAAQGIAKRIGRTVFAGLSQEDRSHLDRLLQRIIVNCHEVNRGEGL